MSTFKIAVIGTFGAFLFIGIIVFAMSKGGFSKSNANLVVWGTLSNEAFQALYDKTSIRESDTIKIKYEKKNEADFDREYIEALAEAKGPDIVILRDDHVYKHRNKLYTLPYKSYPERNFKDTFIEEAETFLTPEGVTAIPLMVDPLVMYWNRDIFTNNSITQPPQYWDQIYSIIDKTTRRDNNANVTNSTIALGEWRNINNAKEILSMLFLQAGTSITKRKDNSTRSVLLEQVGDGMTPGQTALNFYTQFTNPTSNYYTWNRSLPTSQNMFLSGNLAMYIGFASELFSIQEKNPNLNFDVTYVPQNRDTKKKVVFGHMYFMSVSKQSKYTQDAFTALIALTEPKAIKALEIETNLPPVRRDMLGEKQEMAFRTVFYNSALISKTWIDPEPSTSSNTFRDMIESITSGRSKVLDALGRADQDLNSQFR